MKGKLTADHFARNLSLKKIDYKNCSQLCVSESVDKLNAMREEFTLDNRFVVIGGFLAFIVIAIL